MTWSTLKVRNIQVKKDEFKFCLATHIYLLVNEFLLHHIGLLLNFRIYACGAIQLVNQFHVMSYGNGRITYVMLGTRRFIPQKVWINPLFYLFIYFFFFWNALIFRELSWLYPVILLHRYRNHSCTWLPSTTLPNSY